MKQTKIGRNCQAAVFAAGVALFAGWAGAQYQIDSAGRAQDSSNMLGSGGYNGQMPGYSNQGNQLVTGNQIVTGNVTDGKGFRGFVPYGDPMAFRGGTAGKGMDNFVKNSAGTPAPYTASQQQFGAQPFYGTACAVAPPPGFTQQNATGGFTPQQPTLPSQADTRMGYINNSSLTQQPGLGNTLLPGEVDPTARTAPAIGSSLTGLKAQTSSDLVTNQQSLLNGTGGLNSMGPGQAGMGGVGVGLLDDTDAFGRETKKDRMTSETLKNELKKMQRNAPDGPKQQVPGRLDNTVDNTAFANQQENGALGSNPLGGGFKTNEGMHQRVAGAEQVQVSPLMSEMQKRYAEAHPVLKTDDDMNRQFRRDKMSLDEKKAKENLKNQIASARDKSVSPEDQKLVTPDDSQQRMNDIMKKKPTIDPKREAMKRKAEGYTPDGSTTPHKPTPMDVNSLADRMPPSPVVTALTDAEKLMRQGKFQSALAQYDEAAKLAPTSSLVTLGRAHAELGASDYTKADRDLRAAFEADPALLVGRYNLKQFMGQDRLNFLVKDLKELAVAQPNQPRHLFLLAYLSYQMGNADQAAEYLGKAERAEGQPDAVIKSIRENWELPEPKSEKALEVAPK